MPERQRDLIIVGAPGSGKSTQAARLAEGLGAARVNPGMLFRRVAAEDSPRGREIRDLIAEGGLVPDEVTNALVREQLDTMPAERGTVFDGYPRTAAQADALHRVLAEQGRLEPRPAVLRLNVPGDDLLDRLRRRRDVEGRLDDTDEAIARRVEIYDAETAPMLDAVADWADVVTVDAGRPIDAVAEEMLDRLHPRTGRPGDDASDLERPA
jgi:adenylate kinase